MLHQENFNLAPSVNAPLITAHKVFVFDCDGVLADSPNPLNERMARFVMREYSLDLEAARELCWQGYKEAGCSGAYLAERDGHSAQWVEDMYHFMAESYFNELGHTLEPCGVVQSQLQALRDAGYCLTILTQGPQFHARNIASQLEIFPYFDFIMGRDDVETSSKRTEKPYTMLLERFTDKPRELVMVEDSVGNLTAAKALGFTTALLTDTPQLKEPWVDHTATDLKALLADSFLA